MNQRANHLIGKMIRGYCLEEILTSDDATATYRARTQELWQVPELLITVLLLPEHYSTEQRSRFRERFLREAQRIATLRHHYLLPLYGCGEQDGLLYLIEPYIAGETLAEQQRKKGSWTPEEVLALLKPLSMVLDYIHEQGLAYQFLEPEHIVLQNSVTIQLGGLGKRSLLRKRGLEEEDGPTPPYEYLKSITGAYLGAPQYIAPEVLKGAEADRRSDVYSLGVLLCELLSGKPVFEEQGYIEIVEKHVREPLPPLRELAPDLPPSLELVLNRALSRNPERRFQRPAALLNAYSQMLDLRVQTPPPAPLVQQVKEMFALPPAGPDSNFFLPAPRPKVQRPARLAAGAAKPARVADTPAVIAMQSFATQATIVPVPIGQMKEEKTPQPSPVEAEETLLVSREQLMAQMRKSTGENGQQQVERTQEKKHPFEDTAPRPIVPLPAQEKDESPAPVVYAGGNAIGAVNALLQVDTPLNNEIASEMVQLPELENPFEEEPETVLFEQRPSHENAPPPASPQAPRRASLELLYQASGIVPPDSEETQLQAPPQTPRKASLEMVYQDETKHTEDKEQEMHTDEVVFPVSSTGTNLPRKTESLAVNTDASLPLVQTTRTHVMAMASQLQQIKERLQEQSKATGIRRRDDSREVQDETIRQASYRP